MTPRDLTKRNGEWLRGEGPLCDVVISSRIRLARNLAERPFLSTATATERTEIFRRVCDEIESGAFDDDTFVVDMGDVDPLDRSVLVERHLVSRQHAGGEGARGVAIRPDERRAVMINEEDHLRIQGLRSGMQLEEIWDDLNAMDDALASRIPFAYDQQFGFLTACPTNVGTGIRVSVMLHLPGLRYTKEIERVARAAKDLKLAVRGLYGEGTEAVGDFYQVSNQTTLGKSEPELIREFSETIVPRMVQYERTARDTLLSDRPEYLDDKIWRAYGILSNARRIGSTEAQSLLSPIRMGIHMKRFDKIDLPTLNDIFLTVQSAHLQAFYGRPLEDKERSVARASYLRDKFGQG